MGWVQLAEESAEEAVKGVEGMAVVAMVGEALAVAALAKAASAVVPWAARPGAAVASEVRLKVALEMGAGRLD